MSKVQYSAARFQEFRERAGLSHLEASVAMGISDSSVWDLETHDEELSTCYSPTELRRFSNALGVRPSELPGFESSEAPVRASELIRFIHQEYHARGITLEQFEDLVGWRLSACIDPPEKLLEDISIDGLQWLCRELRIDWVRVIAAL